MKNYNLLLFFTMTCAQLSLASGGEKNVESLRARPFSSMKNRSMERYQEPSSRLKQAPFYHKKLLGSPPLNISNKYKKRLTFQEDQDYALALAMSLTRSESIPETIDMQHALWNDAQEQKKQGCHFLLNAINEAFQLNKNSLTVIPPQKAAVTFDDCILVNGRGVESMQIKSEHSEIAYQLVEAQAVAGEDIAIPQPFREKIQQKRGGVDKKFKENKRAGHGPESKVALYQELQQGNSLKHVPEEEKDQFRKSLLVQQSVAKDIKAAELMNKKKHLRSLGKYHTFPRTKQDETLLRKLLKTDASNQEEVAKIVTFEKRQSWLKDITGFSKEHQLRSTGDKASSELKESNEKQIHKDKKHHQKNLAYLKKFKNAVRLKKITTQKEEDDKANQAVVNALKAERELKRAAQRREQQPLPKGSVKKMLSVFDQIKARGRWIDGQNNPSSDRGIQIFNEKEFDEKVMRGVRENRRQTCVQDTLNLEPSLHHHLKKSLDWLRAKLKDDGESEDDEEDNARKVF